MAAGIDSTFQRRPASAKENAWPPAMMIWSMIRGSSNASASRNRRVTSSSVCDGEASPLGWQWQTINAAALRARAPFTTSRGWTDAPSIALPCRHSDDRRRGQPHRWPRPAPDIDHLASSSRSVAGTAREVGSAPGVGAPSEVARDDDSGRACCEMEFATGPKSCAVEREGLIGAPCAHRTLGLVDDSYLISRAIQSQIRR